MDKHLVLSNQQLLDVVGGNAVLGGLGGLQTGIKYCKVPHPVLKGVCIVGFTTAGAYLAYKAN